MTPKDIKKYYKTGYKFSKETGMSQSSLVNWVKWGYVPLVSQAKIEQLTEGKLKSDWEHAQKKGK